MAERLRVGMLAPIAWRVPPVHYGPWERVVSILTEGLVARGVDVTLFATADSITRARLAAVAPRGYAEDDSLDAKVYEGLHIGAAFEYAARGELDILHNHFDFLPLTYSRLVATPVVTTVHGFSSERIVPVYRAYNEHTHLVAISASDRRPDLQYAATIHHGIALDEFTFRPEQGEYLLFFGRIHPDKGVREAIDVARRTRASSSWPASCRTRTTSGAPLSRSWTATRFATSDQLVQPNVTCSWAARRRCSISSNSMSRLVSP